MRVGRGTGPYPSASSRSISQTNAHLLSARLSRGAVCVPRRKKLDQLRGSGLRERAVLAAVLFFEELGQLDRLSLEWLRVLGIGLVRVNEDLLELGPDELALGEERAGDGVDRVLLLAHEPLRVLVERVEEVIREPQHLRRRATHGTWGDREQRRSH